MKRNRSIFLLVFIAFFYACTIVKTKKNASEVLNATSQKTNFLFITTDDHAYQAISAYDSKLIHTPNIDRIAKEGMLFKKAFVTNSICSPSRAVALTGKFSHLNSVRDNLDVFDTLQVTFPKLLQENGYETAIYGKWHLKSKPKGFDFWEVLPDQGHYYNPTFLSSDGAFKTKGYVTDIITEKTLGYLDSLRNKEKPFMLMYNHKAPHRQWWPSLNDLEEFKNKIKKIEEPFVWTIDPDVKENVNLLNSGFMPIITDVDKIHCWQKQNPVNTKVHGYGGVRLWPTSIDFDNIKSSELKLNRFKKLQYVKEIGSTSKPFDIIFLSYNEPNADKNFEQLQDHIRSINGTLKLIWIRNIKGIFDAHQIAATRVSSKMFWVVDADAQLIPNFDFSYIPDVYDEEVVHVWGSKNPINDLEYGYGGVKLFPTDLVLKANSWGMDFTTGLSNRFKSMPEISCITRFNTDAFSTWRSAFRECVKLTINDDAESRQRLEAWINTTGTEAFTEEAVKGATEGNQFALKNKNNLEELNKINDFDWLEAYYDKS